MPEFLYNNKLYYNPVEFAMDRIGGTWTMPILWRLQNKPLRFKGIKQKLPRISDKVLTATLKKLVAEGFVQRTVFAEVPPKVEYALTERGKRTIPVIEYIRSYGISLMNEEGISHH